MKLEFWQEVLCSHITLAQACKITEWELPMPRVGEYIAGLGFLNGAGELPVQKVLHQAQNGMCCIELPAFNMAQLPLSYRELERMAAANGWTLQKI